MCVKRMLYCPWSGQELLTAFGVTIVCHDSNVFLTWKLPLSIKEALLKSIECSRDHAWFAILEFCNFASLSRLFHTSKV